MKKIILLSFLALSFFGCQKRADQAKNDVEIVLQQWKSSLTSQGVRNDLIDSVFRVIDPSINLSISVSNNSSLLLIKAQQAKTDLYSFLGIVCKGGKVINLGFINAKAPSGNQALQFISQFVKKGKISDQGYLEFSTIRGTVFRKEEKLSNGKEMSTYRLPNLKKDLHYLDNTGKLKKGVTSANVDQDPIGTDPVCIDWYLVTYEDGVMISEEYVFTTCESGGSGGGSATYEELSSATADDGKLSCKSFSFSPMTTNMYEAGVSGLHFEIDVAGSGAYFSFPFRNIYIGFPSSTADNRVFSTGEAASYTAKAMNRAALTMALKYQSYTEQQVSAVSKSSLETEFKNLVQIILSNEIQAGATVSFQQSGPTTVTNPAVWNSGWDIIFNGLTGRGCGK